MSDAYLVVLRRWKAAVAQFYDPLDDLALGVRRGHLSAIEQGIVYLETAPRCFRSGYLAEDLFRVLSRASLSEEQTLRCRSIVLASLSTWQARGWREVGALAGAVWTEGLAADLSLKAQAEPQLLSAARRLVLSAAQWWGSGGRRLPLEGLSDDLRQIPAWDSLPWRLVHNWRSLPVLSA